MSMHRERAPGSPPDRVARLRWWGRLAVALAFVPTVWLAGSAGVRAESPPGWSYAVRYGCGAGHGWLAYAGGPFDSESASGNTSGDVVGDAEAACAGVGGAYSGRWQAYAYADGSSTWSFVEAASAVIATPNGQPACGVGTGYGPCDGSTGVTVENDDFTGHDGTSGAEFDFVLDPATLVQVAWSFTLADAPVTDPPVTSAPMAISEFTGTAGVAVGGLLFVGGLLTALSAASLVVAGLRR